MGSSDTDGTITFGPWGRCTVLAEVAVLTARIDAADEDKLEQIQRIIGSNLNRFGRREGMIVTWQRLDTANTPDMPAVPGGAPGKPGAHRGRFRVVVVGVAAVLIVAVHLGLGGIALTNSWTRGAVGLIILVVVIKAAVVLGGFTLRRMRSHPPG